MLTDKNLLELVRRNAKALASGNFGSSGTGTPGPKGDKGDSGTDGTDGVSEAGARVVAETPSGLINGTNQNFTTSQPYLPNSLGVYIGGTREYNFTQTGNSTFQLASAPPTGAEIIVDYCIAGFDSWIPVIDTWTYASATTITVPSGAASRYTKGQKLKLTQTTVKYFYIIGVADTVLTITGGSSYTLVNAAISNIAVSNDDTAIGFPTWFNFGATYSASGSMTWTSVTPARLQFAINGSMCTVLFDASGTTGGTMSYILTITPTAGHLPTNLLETFGSGSIVDTSLVGAWVQMTTANVINAVHHNRTFFTAGTGRRAAGAITYAY